MKIIKRPEVDNDWLSPEIECRTCRTVYQGDRNDIYYKPPTSACSPAYWPERYYLACPVCDCEHTLDKSTIPWDLAQR